MWAWSRPSLLPSACPLTLSIRKSYYETLLVFYKVYKYQEINSIIVTSAHDFSWWPAGDIKRDGLYCELSEQDTNKLSCNFKHLSSLSLPYIIHTLRVAQLFSRGITLSLEAVQAVILKGEWSWNLPLKPAQTCLMLYLDAKCQASQHTTMIVLMIFCLQIRKETRQSLCLSEREHGLVGH